MAEYLPIRALNRSQNVRINKARVSSTTTSYVDLSDPVQRKEFSKHSAIGAVFPVGSISTSLIVTLDGLGVTVKGGTEEKTLVVAAGELFNRSTGAVILTGATELEITKTTTKPRIDNIVVKLSTGVASIQTGTAAESPVAPTVEEGYVVIATLTLAKEKEKAVPGNLASTRVYTI